ncbi:MAG: glycosyltransferase [Candidatus Omnitrophota bacterium]
MKIYIYTASYPTDINRIKSEGTKKAIHILASGLVLCGAEAIVLCEGDRSDSTIMPEGYLIQCFYNPRPGVRKFNIASGLKVFLKNHISKKDILILSGIMQPKIYALSVFLKENMVPYVAWPHDPYAPYFFKKNAHLKWIYWFLFEKKMLQNGRAVQVLDSEHVTFLRSLGIKTPTIAVPNGFLPGEVCPETMLEWDEGGESVPKIFYMGRLTYSKGLDLLIDSFAQVIKTNDARLIIQGRDQGIKRYLLKKITSNFISNKVSFLKPDYDIPTPLIIKNYDILCLPSRFEGFGLVALEAMLAGRVVLVTSISGIASHVKASGCGVVVNSEVSAIASGLTELLRRRSEWKEMGLKGRRYALEYLNPKKIASTALAHYVKNMGKLL